MSAGNKIATIENLGATEVCRAPWLACWLLLEQPVPPSLFAGPVRHFGHVEQRNQESRELPQVIEPAQTSALAPSCLPLFHVHSALWLSRRFKRLKSLFLNNNHIVKIDAAIGRQLLSLEHLMLSNNRIAEFSEIANLKVHAPTALGAAEGACGGENGKPGNPAREHPYFAGAAMPCIMQTLKSLRDLSLLENPVVQRKDYRL